MVLDRENLHVPTHMQDRVMRHSSRSQTLVLVGDSRRNWKPPGEVGRFELREMELEVAHRRQKDKNQSMTSSYSDARTKVVGNGLVVELQTSE